ncbi:hypothetical protein GCM10027046_17070 [Uliginosibacterium flavum]|uniref:S1/P1 nuclease n=1 Tax=Uliginosibacterium flavum TaxID=1396831 RepID=A0ABV2TS49_9RHOO
MRRIVFVMCCVLASSACFAWGGRGHAAVGALAQANLSPAAQAQVQTLLRDDLDRYEQASGRRSLASVASWADEIREVASRTDPKAYRGWHGRSNRVCADTLGKCREGLCVDQLIISNARILKDVQQPMRARNEALKWIVHLVGDLHMPLHSGINSNGGGAKVFLEGVEIKGDATLHGVWDSELANAALKGWKSSAVLGAVSLLADDAPTQWMLETRDVALHEVYEPLSGFACKEKLAEPIVLDSAYQLRSVPVVRQQIERAGLRLAQLLNQLLP